MTLVELLVVLCIVLMLAAATIPRLRPDMDKARVREAARSIQLYLSSARVQAMATGVPCGVMIEPLVGVENGCSMQLTQVETPAPYGRRFRRMPGDDPMDRPTRGTQLPRLLRDYAFHVCEPQLQAGDLAQVGYQGYSLNVCSNPNNNNPIYPPGTTTIYANIDCSHGETPAWLYQPITGPYKICAGRSSLRPPPCGFLPRLVST